MMFAKAVAVIAAFSLNTPATTDNSGAVDISVGDKVSWVDFGAVNGVRFPGKRGYDPEKIITSDNNVFNPNSGAFAVEMRIRVHSKGEMASPNITQKGQSGSKTGFWKVTLNHSGYPNCHFRDKRGNTSAVIPKVNLVDGKWHKIRCERLADGSTKLSFTVDGVWQSHYNYSRTKEIYNNVPLTIGGKLNCTDVIGEVGCDYFKGDMDWIRYYK